ncbi:hypothetical protein [Allohahella sp. A8]|uniref:hypothetical protein n=1 Tax=Allohahella sp. A8 TaxID=3141461 RepID=UPI003A805A5C
MYNNDMPSREELPSSGKLIRSTIIAAVVAAVLLVTVVMPAEYALDPTGLGRMLGLTEMGEIKAQLDEEEAAELARQAEPAESAAVAGSVEPAAPVAEPAEPVAETAVAPEPQAELAAEEPAPAAKPKWRDEIRVVLTPGEGTEYKLTMEEGAVARYSWTTEGGPLNYDTHGDGSGQSISYEKGRGVAADEGEITAAFTGNHGWFFRNRNAGDVTLVLRTNGDYGELKKAM